MLAATPCVFVFWLLRSVFVATHRTRAVAWLGLATLVANVVANLFLIPGYGVTGACITTAACELAACAGALALLRRGGSAPELVRPGVRALLACAVTAGAMLGARALTGYALLGLPAGAAVAHLALCRTGYWREDERARLARWRLAW
jgi:peptidoglycan biosynthesis protein MviN/MurJ (putative lipid II flippase)